jgi:hypothetical protein
MRGGEYVACMTEKGNPYRALVGRPQERKPFRRHNVDEWMLSKRFLKKSDGKLLIHLGTSGGPL